MYNIYCVYYIIFVIFVLYIIIYLYKYGPLLRIFHLFLVISFARMSEIKKGSCHQENKGDG